MANNELEEARTIVTEVRDAIIKKKKLLNPAIIYFFLGLVFALSLYIISQVDSELILNLELLHNKVLVDIFIGIILAFIGILYKCRFNLSIICEKEEKLKIVEGLLQSYRRVMSDRRMMDIYSREFFLSNDFEI